MFLTAQALELPHTAGATSALKIGCDDHLLTHLERRTLGDLYQLSYKLMSQDCRGLEEVMTHAEGLQVSSTDTTTQDPYQIGILGCFHLLHFQLADTGIQ